jgi:hypothetical protein
VIAAGSGALSAGSAGAATVGAEDGMGATSSAGGSGTLPQAASIPTIATKPGNRYMLLILLEALLALLVLVFIVWWTMFAGRKKGEPVGDDKEE